MLTRFARFFIFLAVLSMVSCQKDAGENLLPISLNEETTTFENQNSLVAQNEEVYMIDNKIVSKDDFKWGVDGMHYHVNVGEKDNPNSQAVSYIAYTNEADFDTYMHQLVGDKYARHKAITEHLRDYAQTSGAITYYEQHGAAPQTYLDYEKRYLQQNLTPEEIGAAQQRTIVGFLFKRRNCVNAFNMSLPLLGTPFFIFNNNEASSFEGLLIGGFHMGFDRSFYRRKIYSIATWSLTCNDMPAAVDDQISSWWSIGV